VLVGWLDGDADGVSDGASLATGVGCAEGDPVGSIEGEALGDDVGAIQMLHSPTSSHPLLLDEITPGSESYRLQSNMF